MTTLPDPDRTYDLSRRHVNPTRGAVLEAFLGTRVVMGRREGPRFENAVDGRWYWNCHCNGGVFNLGHRPPAVVAAVRDALEVVFGPRAEPHGAARLAQAREGVRLAELSYRAGKSSLVEYIDAQQAYAATQAELIAARQARAEARAILSRQAEPHQQRR